MITTTIRRTAILGDEPTWLSSRSTATSETSTVATEEDVVVAVLLSSSLQSSSQMSIETIAPESDTQPTTDINKFDSDYTTETSRAQPTMSQEMNQNNLAETLAADASQNSKKLQNGTMPISKSTQVGVAVGVPIAIFVIFFMALGFWYFLRLRKQTQSANITRIEGEPKRFNFDFVEKSEQSTDTGNEKPYADLFSPTNYLKTAKDLESYSHHKPLNYGASININNNNNNDSSSSNIDNIDNIDSSKGVFKRLSMWAKRDKRHSKAGEDVEVQQQRTSLPHLSTNTTSTSPTSLRKFHLTKGKNNFMAHEIDANNKNDKQERGREEENGKGKSKGKGDAVSNDFTGREVHFMDSRDSSQFPAKNKVDAYDKSVYVVTRAYQSQLPDELSIKVGDKCMIMEQFEDGWCKVRLLQMAGTNRSKTDKMGLVPKLCLQNYI
ncbi:fus1 actin binding protein [Lodderomyces elongisporus]|uniref:fus1 actin binding protein n=1 Tax=Lodderomyces elongisporus TaxID=36914 RepID=UPI00292656F0|nr:fus1 actin binding protein [Lodderomyces elongisporus]WLF76828.1 fus1 actin binding protein [Lodderomyces elongisporus]